jgi:PTH1 family peptidyl-tRNA hydrolase
LSKLIVGLGNPGPQYTWTRHNFGFQVVHALALRHQALWRNSSVHDGFLAKTEIENIQCSLLMPLTFMNHSGLSLKKLVARQGIIPEDILVICDDLSLSFGKMRLRSSGSAGGHNGLKSIIGEIATDQFARLRLGIGQAPGGCDAADYVLANFTPAEKKALPDLINHALDCVTCWVTEGAQVAMNRFNRESNQQRGQSNE